MTHCALRATTNADGTGNRLAAIGAVSLPVPASKLAPGTIIAEKIVIIRPVGGRVYLARDKVLQRDVALKFQKDGPAGRDALIAEADILARCDHPSIVTFYRTYASAPSEPAFFAMKAYPSARSSALSRHSSLVSRHCAEAVASALAYLHALSPPVAHGDITSDNILFDSDGHAVLAGFGKARFCIGEDATTLADDVQALGVLLRDAWDGRPPRALRPLLARMLADDPAARPSAAQVTAELSHAPRSRRRRTAACATAAALAAAALTFFVHNPVESSSDPIIDEVHSPSVTAAHSLHRRLPDFSREAIRRIPWDYTTVTFDTAKPGVSDYLSRYQAFQGGHPDRLQFGQPTYPGTLRLIRLPGDVQLEMTTIPAGFFRRNFFLPSDSRTRADFEIGPDSVLVSKPFWMARTELTRAQYAAVMRIAPAVAGRPARRLRHDEGRGGRALEIEGGDLPVGEDLDLADVERYIERLNVLCGLEGERRFRLPTEAEWELACRAFIARPFEGEKKPADAAWFAENSGGVPHPVAQKAQNPLGLFDMHGNLAEWCADAYGPLPDWAPFDPCVAPASNAAPRVVRGGSFRDPPAACDSDARTSALPTDKGHAIRLVAFP